MVILLYANSSTGDLVTHEAGPLCKQSAVALYKLAGKEILWKASSTPELLNTPNRSAPELCHSPSQWYNVRAK